MAEKRYFWMKLPEDFFQSKRIKKLRNLAGGDTYTIIYLKMQLKALKTDGYLYFDGIMSDFAEELALDIDENPEDVKVTIQYLLSVGLLETSDDETYCLCFLKDMIGSETAHTQRQRDYIKRKKERELLEKASQNDADVTQMLRTGDAEIDIEIDIDKDIDNNTSKKQINYQEIINLYHQNCPSFPKVTKITEARKKLIRARLKDYSIGELVNAFVVAEESDFLKHGNGTWNGANFDWIMNPNNIVKILEGNYKNKTETKSGYDLYRTTKRSNYDFEQLEYESKHKLEFENGSN